MSTPVHTRIAPSPTGLLHIGTARTALVNYLYARQHGGTFSIRSEDTDKERSTKAFEENILEGLSWLGIEHDLFTRQSDDVNHHIEAIEALLAADKAYESTEPSKNDPDAMVTVIRLRNPGKDITFTDLVRDDVTFNTEELGDFVIARSKTDPLYHLAVVVDDARAGVTHVIRGEDHISNTPRQILIQEALGYERPTYAHLPLILNEDRSKMSKRKNVVAISEYKQRGYLPNALTNYLALLGWHPEGEEEIFTLAELTQAFGLERVQKGGAVFSLEKLNWINKMHLNTYSEAEFLELLKAYIPEHIHQLPQFSEERLTRMAPILRERVHVFGEVAEEPDELTYFFTDPTYAKEDMLFKGKGEFETAHKHLGHIQTLLNDADPTLWNGPESLKECIWDYATEQGRGDVLWPLRMALSGRDKSPDPFSLLYIFGPEESAKRISAALAILEA